MIKIQFSAQIDNIMAKKDRTLSLKLGTQELGSEDSSYLLSLMGKQLWIGLAETEIESLEVPDVVPEMKGEKSPSQRLKAIIYKIWELKSGQKQPFPSYYEDYMFKLCESLKGKLE